MNARNPRHNSNGTIDCEIEHPVFGWIPFTASPEDVEEHGKEIFAKAQKGEFGTVAPAPPPAPSSPEELKASARAKVADDYRKAPPASQADRITALEIIMGLRDPDIEAGSNPSPVRD